MGKKKIHARIFFSAYIYVGNFHISDWGIKLQPLRFLSIENFLENFHQHFWIATMNQLKICEIILPEWVIKAETISAVNEIWPVKRRQGKSAIITADGRRCRTFLRVKQFTLIYALFTDFPTVFFAIENFFQISYFHFNHFKLWYDENNTFSAEVNKFTCVGLQGPNKLLFGTYPSAFGDDSMYIAPPSWLLSTESARGVKNNSYFYGFSLSVRARRKWKSVFHFDNLFQCLDLFSWEVNRGKFLRKRNRKIEIHPWSTF